MPQNWFATLTLAAWPIVALFLYFVRPVAEATLLTILGAYLLLPTDAVIKFEMIPQIDKISLPNVAALIGCALVARRSLGIWRRIGLAEVLLLVYLFSPLVTAELNRDPIILANRILPPDSIYDALSTSARQFLFIIPFFLGRELLRNPADSQKILRVLVVAGLLYSLPILFEIRMSPQLHYWLYGYYPTEFVQEMREGGYRPMVFMGHGLLVAFFAMTAALAATGFWRAQVRILRLPLAAPAAYLTGVLMLCKSLGALVYGLFLIPLVYFAKPRTYFKVAVVLAAFALLYPVLRVADFVPTKSIVGGAALFSSERESSIQFRFDQEDRLLDHASQRIFFGWGRWGRGRVYDERSGADVSVTDGYWIVTVTQFGLFGFIAAFGLLALPVFRAASAFKFAAAARDRIMLGTLTLVVAANIIDLLPNSSIRPWTWLLAGAVLGQAESLRPVTRYKEQIRILHGSAETGKLNG